MRNVLASLVVLVVLRVAPAATVPVTCSGVVVGPDDKPVAGATVQVFAFGSDRRGMGIKTSELGQAQSDADGRYTVTVRPETGDGWYEMIAIASKPGLAWDWANGDLRQGKQAWDFKLETPGRIAGTVVDENGRPIRDAEIKLIASVPDAGGKSRLQGGRYLGYVPMPGLTVKTDAAGRFAYAFLPARARAEFELRATGRATMVTAPMAAALSQGMQYRCGQEDIRITLRPEGRIEARVVEQATGKPVAGVQVLFGRKQRWSWFDTVMATTDTHGVTRVGALSEGDYTIGIHPGEDGAGPGVADTVDCTVQPGKTTTGVTIKMMKGTRLDFTVVDTAGKPVAEAYINLESLGKGGSYGAQTDSAGVAHTRVLAGKYRLRGVYVQQGYERLNLDEILTVEEGKTYTRRFTLTAAPRITGTVRGPDGKPAADVRVGLLPHGRDTVSTEEDGTFVLQRYNDFGPREDSRCFVIARQPEKNLAAAVEITDEVKPVEIRLAPGLTFRGRVVDPAGKPIAGVSARPWLDGGRWRTAIRDCESSTNAKGEYELTAVPSGPKYTIDVSGTEHGSKQTPVKLETAKDNQVTVEDTVLAPANLSATGQVVDAKGRPLSGVNISVYGQNQPLRNTLSDKDGKFVVTGLCEGSIRVSAWDQATRHNGHVQAKAGDQDLRIIVTDPETQLKVLTTRPVASLHGRPLPPLAPFQISPAADVRGKSVVVCFFDPKSRPSRHVLKQLGAQADLFRSKHIALVGVSVSSASDDELRECARKQQISFPLGRVSGEVEKVKTAWGVQSLPWLVLTDEKHVVRAEGLTLEETLRGAK